MSAIKHIIAIASGKGGVGKSTTAVNLALALLQEGQGKLSVGLLDADIYGPSQPVMLGITHKASVKPGKKFVPIERHGLYTMSIGYLIDNETPMIWRGPMVSKAVQQLMGDTYWPLDLDYLIVDLPPGTGDIHLTLVQKVSLRGAIIVTTPQDVALIDAKKALAMFQKVNKPVLGIIENMSGYQCSACGYQENIFGEGGGARVASKTGVPLLGQLPLDARLCRQMDNGEPPAVSDPSGSVAMHYRSIARRVMDGVNQLIEVNNDGNKSRHVD